MYVCGLVCGTGGRGGVVKNEWQRQYKECSLKQRTEHFSWGWGGAGGERERDRQREREERREREGERDREKTKRRLSLIHI